MAKCFLNFRSYILQSRNPTFSIYSTEIKAAVFKDIYSEIFPHYCLEEQKLEMRLPSIAERLSKSQLVLSIEYYLDIQNNEFYNSASYGLKICPRYVLLKNPRPRIM